MLGLNLDANLLQVQALLLELLPQLLELAFDQLFGQGQLGQNLQMHLLGFLLQAQ